MWMVAALLWGGPAMAQSGGQPPTAADAGPEPEGERQAADTPPPSAESGAAPAAVRHTVTVMGFEVVPRSGTYRVTADANVRKGPGTQYERIEGVREGERIQVIGRPEDTAWFAISRAGETIGFVYQSILTPVVDGTIGEEIRDRIVVGDVACDYRLRFEGRHEVEGGDFETADYEILFRCANAFDRAIFYGHMFLTEAPVDTTKGRHQIGFDVRSIGDGLENFLSSTFYFDPDKGVLTFVGHSLPEYALPPKQTRFQDLTTQRALVLAMETAVATWTPKAWQALFEGSATGSRSGG